jgi:LacI family transcriptional regulator
MTNIKDIAKACGVSTATVSYVLNGKQGPGKETRDRILQTMRALNYHPSAVARGLSIKRMNTIGIMFGIINIRSIVTHTYASHILQGVLNEISETDYNVTIFTDAWKSARESALLYRDQRADGIVVIAPPLTSDIVSGLTPIGIPIIPVSFPGEEYSIPSVDTDNRQATRLVMEHLFSLGHKRIAHLSGPSDMFSSKERQEAYLDEMIKAGQPVFEHYVDRGDFEGVEGYEQTKFLLSLPNPPTAIYASNDVNAEAAIAAANDAGVQVPRQLSVVGCDDTIRAAMGTPPLTSIHQPLTEIGELATKLLLKQLDGEEVSPTMRLLPSTLIIRESTAEAIRG